MTKRKPSKRSSPRFDEPLDELLVPGIDDLFPVVAQPWVPHAYQKKAVKFLLEHACAALFLDPGLGKTAITLAAFLMLKKRGLASKALVIAPLQVAHSVWPTQTEVWKDFNGLRVVVLHGPHKDDLLTEDADLYVINPEGLEWLLQIEKSKTPSGKTRVSLDTRRFKKLGFDTLVIDELTKFKNMQANRFKSLKLVIPTFARRWGLTGSPAANGLLGLFGQCYILDEGRALGRYVTHYRQTYFKTVDHAGFVWVPKEGAEELIYERVAPLALRMDADDYLEMPTLIPNNIKLELPDAARRVYDELQDDLLAQVEDRVVTAQTAAVASMKCRQVAAGGIYLTPDLEPSLTRLAKTKREWAEVHNVKTEALADLVDELQGQPVLVAYDFGHDLERFKKKFGQHIPVIGGKSDARKTKPLIKAWNNGKLPFLFVHPASAAHGLDGLQHVGQHVAWHTLTWDYELYDQLIRRLRRQGNSAPRVTSHHFIMRDTVDEAQMWALQRKKKGQQSFFQGLQLLAKRRRRR